MYSVKYRDSNCTVATEDIIIIIMKTLGERSFSQYSTKVKFYYYHGLAFDWTSKDKIMTRAWNSLLQYSVPIPAAFLYWLYK